MPDTIPGDSQSSWMNIHTPFHTPFSHVPAWNPETNFPYLFKDPTLSFLVSSRSRGYPDGQVIKTKWFVDAILAAPEPYK